MIRPVLTAALILLLLHLLAAMGFVAWLAASGRVNHERIEQVVDTFKLTVEEEQRQQEEAARLAQEAAEKARQAAMLEAVADGPRTLQDRLAAQQQADELALHRVERLQRETDDLRRQIERAKEVIAKQKADLEAQRAAFDAYVQQELARRQDADFQQAVQMYEQLPPDQVKRMFQQLIAQGQIDQVVEYLAAMELRKAGKVIQAFETDQEVAQATQLLEMLRQREVYPPGQTVAQESGS